jgi:hypothetical protein
MIGLKPHKARTTRQPQPAGAENASGVATCGFAVAWAARFGRCEDRARPVSTVVSASYSTRWCCVAVAIAPRMSRSSCYATNSPSSIANIHINASNPTSACSWAPGVQLLREDTARVALARADALLLDRRRVRDRAVGDRERLPMPEAAPGYPRTTMPARTSRIRPSRARADPSRANLFLSVGATASQRVGHVVGVFAVGLGHSSHVSPSRAPLLAAAALPSHGRAGAS